MLYFILLASEATTITSVYCNIGSADSVNGTASNTSSVISLILMTWDYLQYKNIKYMSFNAHRVLLLTHEGKCNTIRERCKQGLVFLGAASQTDVINLNLILNFSVRRKKWSLNWMVHHFSPLCEVKETIFLLRKAYWTLMLVNPTSPVAYKKKMLLPPTLLQNILKRISSLKTRGNLILFFLIPLLTSGMTPHNFQHVDLAV